MAEQDRYGAHFGADTTRPIREHASKAFSSTSGAEQDRYDHWFGGKTPYYSAKARELAHRLSQTSGAEQDRYASHFDSSRLPSAQDVSDRLPHTSGAEQDRLGGWFQDAKDQAPSLDDMTNKMPRTSGAEQDRLGGWFQTANESTPSLDSIANKMPRASGAEQDRFGSHFGRYPTNPINATAVGLLQTAVLPSLGFHSGLSAVAYAVARYTDRAEVKDYLWPAGMTANTWWSAVGTRVFYDGLTLPQAWSTITYSQRLLLTGVSAWGLRLLYRVASRSLRRGTDDPRYITAKKENPSGFWNKAFFTLFVPEAVAQTLIALPFTLPFRASLESVAASPAIGYNSVFSALAVFLFSTGFALEILADTQLEAHKQKNTAEVNRQGVWSIVRHPNYLGDALMHMSFPFLLLGASALHPLALIGPVANYLFLRFVGGDRQNEEYQQETYAKENPLKAQQFEEYKREKNSFWPSLNELKNQWTWIVLAAGAAGVVVEQGVKAWARG